MRFSAVIFDLDGTLLNTLDDIADSVNEVLQRGGFPEHPVDSYRLFVGDGARVLMEKALPKEIDNPHDIDTYLEEFRREYHNRWNRKSKPYRGIEEMLRQLHGLGIPFAVLSNKPDAFTKLCVSHYFPDTGFRVIRGMLDSVPRKPDPAGALATAEIMGVSPGQCLFVGDSSIDMRTANRSEMHAVGVSWGFRSVEELRATGAQQIIDTPHELTEILKNS